MFMKNIYLSLLLFLLSVSSYSQNSGVLDASFATDGILQWNPSSGHENGHGIVALPDGRILIAFSADFSQSFDFDIAVTRLNEDGSVDESFGTDGIYLYQNTAGSDLVYDLKVLDDGSMFVVGSHSTTAANTEFLVIKLDSDGVPDDAFGVNGVVILPIDTGEDYAHGIAITEAGQIIIGGYSHVPGFFYSRHIVCRLNANGSLDQSFGNNGIFLWGTTDTYNEIWNIGLLPDGGILASGQSQPAGTSRPSLYKIRADGSALDVTFGDNGAVLAPYEGTAYSMAIHPNGNILLAGGSLTNDGNDVLVLAYNQDGTPHTEFGIDGAFMANVGINDVALGMTIQSDGKILVCGESGGTFFSGPPRNFLSVRLDELGVIDTTWGGTGSVITDISDFFAFANDVAIQPDGKVLLTGAGAFNNNDLIVVRYGNFIDADRDGFALGEDCNDADAAINPQGIEIADNGIDEDCDGNDLVTGIKENTWAAQIALYPNPATAYMRIDFGDINVEQLRICDAAGRQLAVYDMAGAQSEAAINLGAMPQGVLLIYIYSHEGVAIKKLIRQ